VHGDAEHLPFPDNAFDVVTNVESSHSYPNLERFYRETHRVLRAGGRFLYTDLLAKDRWLTALTILENLGFTTEVARDITENVLLSCDETGRRHLQSFRRENDAELMAEFLGLSGSATYEGMKRGASSYRIYRLSAAKGMSRECLALSGVPATARHELSVV
jgi:ubiquinone/menaquinone biosynthesis C-methylase UbiE